VVLSALLPKKLKSVKPQRDDVIRLSFAPHGYSMAEIGRLFEFKLFSRQ
jgi:hypothetical protein